MTAHYLAGIIFVSFALIVLAEHTCLPFDVRSDRSGILTDGSMDGKTYSPNMNCSFLIAPNNIYTSEIIEISFQSA